MNDSKVIEQYDLDKAIENIYFYRNTIGEYSQSDFIKYKRNFYDIGCYFEKKQEYELALKFYNCILVHYNVFRINGNCMDSSIIDDCISNICAMYIKQNKLDQAILYLLSINNNLRNRRVPNLLLRVLQCDNTFITDEFFDKNIYNNEKYVKKIIDVLSEDNMLIYDFCNKIFDKIKSIKDFDEIVYGVDNLHILCYVQFDITNYIDDENELVGEYIKKIEI